MKPAGLKITDTLPRDPAAALELLMEQYGATVMRTAYFYTGDRHLAEDIAQEAFLRAYRKWTSFRGESSVKTWLTAITVNLCRDKMGVRMFDEQPTDPSTMERGRPINAEEQALERFRNSVVLQHVLQLPLPYQESL
ncbi:MAG: polymerase subunit sigma-24, partial [Paenibacillus sp.]|nr:polymerase subunit sigma-24 [Paenibacillus sp.]